MEMKRITKEESQEKLAKGLGSEGELKSERDSGEDNSQIHASALHSVLDLIVTIQLTSELHSTKQTPWTSFLDTIVGGLPL